MKIKDVAEQFIVRRAFRHGSVSRADLRKVISISSATATRIMSETMARFPNLLERKGHSLVPLPLAECPGYANEADLMKHIDAQKCDPATLGLFDDELPLLYNSWVNSLPPQPGTLQTIVMAIQQRKQMNIVYLSLELGEKPRNRKILALALEKVGDQWRVVAQDMEDASFPVKAFVLTRIMTASFSLNPTRVSLPYVQGYTDGQINLLVMVNPKFIPVQQKVVAHELGVKEGMVTIKKRSECEFKRRFVGWLPGDNEVHPPLIVLDMQA